METIPNPDCNENPIAVDFDFARKSTRNGTQRTTHVIKGRSFQYIAGASRSRAYFLFDLRCGNHNLTADAQQAIREQFDEYLTRENFQPRGHTSVTHKCVQLEVRSGHANEWWRKIWEILCDLGMLERIRMDDPFDLTSGFIFPQDLLRVLGAHLDGELIEVDREKLRDVSEILSLNYERIRSLNARQVEMLVAAIYSSTQYFDRVVLTPATRDHGRDVILERDDWGERRFLIEVKAHQSMERSTPPHEIDAILGVGVGEAIGSCVALFSTSYFSSEIEKRPNVRNTIRRTLQLVNFLGLVEYAIQATYSDCPDVLSELQTMVIERQ